jgi:hypothetical protein
LDTFAFLPIGVQGGPVSPHHLGKSKAVVGKKDKSNLTAKKEHKKATPCVYVSIKKLEPKEMLHCTRNSGACEV